MFCLLNPMSYTSSSSTPGAFVRRPRIHVTTPELEAQENQWWEKHSQLIHEIWGLPEALSDAVRGPYLLATLEKLLRELPARPLKILELGCGAGWASRHLATTETKLTGIDFSENQIALARQNAKEHKLNCNYVVGNFLSADQQISFSDCDAVFVHCALHHLSTEELHQVFGLFSKLPKGSKVVLIEPVYLDQGSPLLAWLDKPLRKLSRKLWGSLHVSAPANQILQKQTEDLIEESNSKAWFLSPKEVPFTVEELSDLATGAGLKMTEAPKPVTYFGLETAQTIVMLADKEKTLQQGPGAIAKNVWLDDLLLTFGILPRLTNNYFFCRICLEK